MNKPPVDYGDVVYSKSFSAFNGYSESACAKITISVDPGGVIKPGNETFAGAVPGRIQFYTANDNGKMYKAGEFDKAGRFLTNEHWSITRNPSGNPLLLMLNSDDNGNGATLSLRRSRGTYDEPTSVQKDDSIFKIAWYAHDGQSYKESSSINVFLDGEVSLGNVPGSIVFKTFNKELGKPTDSLVINSDKSVSVQSLSSLNSDSNIQINSGLSLRRVENETERDAIIPNPLPGTLVFLLNLDTVQVYTKRLGWQNLF